MSVQWRGGRGRGRDNILGALKFEGGAKIRNCQCEILCKICKVQLVNKFKDSSNSGISIAIQVSNSFLGISPLLPFSGELLKVVIDKPIFAR